MRLSSFTQDFTILCTIGNAAAAWVKNGNTTLCNALILCLTQNAMDLSGCTSSLSCLAVASALNVDLSV